MQACPAAQLMPHHPQLVGSDARSVQCPAQSVAPVGQIAFEHVPNKQAPELQLCVHEPHWVCIVRSAHPPAHVWDPGVHPGLVHIP